MGAGRPTQRGDFDTAAAARIVGVPPARLRQCARAGLVTPRHDARGRLRFDFVDLVLLRTMRGLLDRGVPVRQIARVLASLRRQIGDKPLTQLRVFVDGARVVAWDGASRWQPESGQFLFNFDAADVVRKAGRVARLRQPAAPPKAEKLPRLSADEWTDLAVELEPSSPLEARAAYHHAIDIDPGHLVARINLGRLLHAEGNFAGAESHYREAIRHEPASGLAWFNLGVLLEDTGRAEEALTCYETAVRVEPDFADAHYNLALLYERIGRGREAVRHFSIYRRLAPRGRYVARARRAVRVLAGTSGFSYPAWRGPFYPEDLPAKAMLAFYARALGTVEINHTFHRLPTTDLLTGWSRQVPTGFRFALKAPQRITHFLRLKDAGELTARFCRLATTLGPKLGPLLFQLPPYVRADQARLADFLATLPPGFEPAFEFRSPTWFTDATWELLAKHRAALCIADADDLQTPPVATAPFAYLRLRRSDYDDAALDAWAARLRDERRWQKAYVFFKHEDSGRGPALARALLARLA